MEHLTTVPSFIFYQGDTLSEGEYPLQVLFWRDGCISIKQIVADEEREIVLKKEYVKPFMTAILKMLPQAEKILSEK